MNGPNVSFLKALFRSNPAAGFEFMASQNGLPASWPTQLQGIFDQAKRIDIIPMDNADHQGFIIILNQALSLWFYRKGNEYRYDGFEIGPYDQGSLDPAHGGD